MDHYAWHYIVLMFYFHFKSECFACMYLCAEVACLVTTKAREGIQSFGTEVIQVCQLPCGYWVFWGGASESSLHPPRIQQTWEDVRVPQTGALMGAGDVGPPSDWCRSQLLLKATSAAEAGGMCIRRMSGLQSKFKASLENFVK